MKATLLHSFWLILCLATVRGETNIIGESADFKNGTYTEFAVRPDSEGKHIAAHHGGVIFVDGKYWWYGQTFQELC